MLEDDADDLVAFFPVRVITATVQALFCAVDGRRVWLPRHHIKGHLICRGDCGLLFIRRWLARDRHLTPHPVAPTVMRSRRQGRLYVLPSRKMRSVH